MKNALAYLICILSVGLVLRHLIQKYPDRIFDVNYAHLEYFRYLISNDYREKDPDIVILGDSTVLLGFQGRQLGSAVTFGAGGLSTIEYYFHLKKYLESERKQPKVLILQLPLFPSIYQGKFWTFARFGFYDGDELLDILKTSREVDALPDENYWLPFFAAKAMLYHYQFPPLFQSSIAHLLSNRNRDKVQGCYDIVEKNAGNLRPEILVKYLRQQGVLNTAAVDHIKRRGKDIMEQWGEPLEIIARTGFKASALQHHYLEATVRLAKSRGIAVIGLEMPISDELHAKLNSDHISEARQYYKENLKKYGAHFWHLETRFPKGAFLDQRHLSQKGAEVFTDLIHRKLTATKVLNDVGHK